MGGPARRGALAGLHGVRGRARPGALRLLKRVLTQFGVDDARVRLEWISASEGDRVQHVINEMTGQLRKLGPWHARS